MNRKIAVVGLGYVGLPVAVAFGNKHNVIGFDINQHRIDTLKSGHDYTNEVSSKELKETNVKYISDVRELKESDFIIVAVPTPIDEYNRPDLTPLLRASETVAKALKPGTIVVYESTVYPGVTEDECVPVLEKVSGLKCGVDFFVGYSPERINPGDKEHTFTKIKKVVSGQNAEVLDIVAEVYASVVEAGVHKASSIKVAEAAKVIENTQRDVNIALMNELAIIFDKIGIDTAEVLAAAGTKWNFLNFSPGLVGGHCIGIDPYYLTHKAEAMGHHPEVILAGRRINDQMGKFVATSIVKQLIKNNIFVQQSVVTVLGLTFKENVPDLRNSKVIDVIKELEDYGITIQVADYEADIDEAKKLYNVDLVKYEDLIPSHAVVLAVPHTEYVRKSWSIKELLIDDSKFVFDLKAALPSTDQPNDVVCWRL
ncbi:nucleotide sugar dehydrogenase [Lysinibacillus irui]|uniref:nucleotide sugar dehydrogenase n=1 Tax=Lysinibacillus irui TaxID=2998077 RepID=UPI00388BA548